MFVFGDGNAVELYSRSSHLPEQEHATCNAQGVAAHWPPTAVALGSHNDPAFQMPERLETAPPRSPAATNVRRGHYHRHDCCRPPMPTAIAIVNGKYNIHRGWRRTLAAQGFVDGNATMNSDPRALVRPPNLESR